MYNTFAYNNAEVYLIVNEIQSEKSVKLVRNKELGFLYKKCKKIRPYVISQIALVPEYIEALKAYTGSLDDDSVYEVIKGTFKNMLADGKGYRTARDAMNKISKDVKGDSFAWQYKNDNILGEKSIEVFEFLSSINKVKDFTPIIDDNNKDLAYLFDVCTIPPRTIQKIISTEILSNEFRKYGEVSDDKEAYEVFSNVFFPIVRKGYKTSNDEDKRRLYYRLRAIAQKFSKVIYGDDLSWHNDYQKKYS